MTFGDDSRDGVAFRKVVRTGVTESAMLMLRRDEHKELRRTDFAERKLWHAWNSIGFYDSGHPVPIDQANRLAWDEHTPPTFHQYWDRYLDACDGADVIVHLRRSLEDAEENGFGGQAAINRIFVDQDDPPHETVRTFRYSWAEAAAVGRRVVIVSPFASVMKQQVEKGHIAVLRPNFVPRDLAYFGFPYCFGNAGPHATSFETIDWALASLRRLADPDTLFLLSCGSMGVIIADELTRSGARAFYCGGAMQLYFGIMGGRWRGGREDRALHPADRLLDSWRANPEVWVAQVPDAYVPDRSAAVEGGCYW